MGAHRMESRSYRVYTATGAGRWVREMPHGGICHTNKDFVVVSAYDGKDAIQMVPGGYRVEPSDIPPDFVPCPDADR